VLPQSLGHLVDAPTPYIIGILSTGMLDSEIVENFSEVSCNFCFLIYFQLKLIVC